MKKMQDDASDQLRKIFEDHASSKAELEAQREVLESREKELKGRQHLNQSERRKLYEQKKMVIHIQSVFIHSLLLMSQKIKEIG